MSISGVSLVNSRTLNTYIGHTTNTPLSPYVPLRHKRHKTASNEKHNKDTDKLESPNLRKIVINNRKSYTKNNNKNIY